MCSLTLWTSTLVNKSTRYFVSKKFAFSPWYWRLPQSKHSQHPSSTRPLLSDTSVYLLRRYRRTPSFVDSVALWVRSPTASPWRRYLTKPLPAWLQATPVGNYAHALALGMEPVPVPSDVYRAMAATRRPPPGLLPPGSLWVPQGVSPHPLWCTTDIGALRFRVWHPVKPFFFTPLLGWKKCKTDLVNFPCSFVFLVVASAVTGQLVYYIFFGYNFGGNVGFFPQFSLSSLHLPAALNPIANSLKKNS